MPIRPRILLAPAVLAVAALFPAPAAADVNGFEGGDGDQSCLTAAVDWACLPAGRIVTPAADGTGLGDDVFTSGSKEEQPQGWAFEPGDASRKTDIRRLWGSVSESDTETFLHLAFWRDGGDGNAFFSFELNQSPATWSNGSATISCRTDDDLLVSYEIPSSGSAVTIKTYRWEGTTGPAACPDGGTGSWTPSGGTLPAAGDGEGAINSAGLTPNVLDGGPASFLSSTFGEAAIDLGALADAVGIDEPCAFFGSLQAHSRSSSEFNSTMKDFVAGTPIQAAACRPPGGDPGDTTPPDAPTLTARVECPSRTVVLSGTAEPGSQVQVREGTVTRGLATAAASGAWSLALTNVAEGDHAYNARARDAAANVSGATSLTVTVNCPDPDPDPDPVPSGDAAGAAPPALTGQAPSQTALPGTGARGCVSRPFTVFVPRKGLRRVVFFVDGRRMKVVRKVDRYGRFSYRVDPAIFPSGSHRIRARLIPRRGRARSVPMRGFTLCNLGPCVSRRAFRIRVKNQRGTDDAVKATVYVNGRRVKVLRGRRLTAPVRLTGLPQGRFTVKIVAVTKSGRVVRDTRKYRTCVPPKKKAKKRRG